MKRINWQVLLGASLLMLSIVFYFLHYLLFRDPHHIFIYMIGDVGFVFIEVLLVTLIIHRVLDEREKKVRLNKLNMVIGAFFSAVGTELLRMMSERDHEIAKMQEKFVTEHESTSQKLEKMRSYLKKHGHNIEIEKLNWDTVKEFLMSKRDFLLRLLENPNLLEHESFTEVLWAVFHLADELQARETFQELPEADIRHLAGDAQRVYGKLAQQWLEYMKHLQGSYPYLFSLAMRLDPFNRNATPIVQESQ